MNLITPGFLIGLAAVAVPVVLHLVRREEPSGRPFPSLMFLRRMPYKTRRQRTLRDPLLLALRCLALALLALAFAGPHWPAPEAAPPAADNTLDRVFLLDRSYSMSHPDLWSGAIDALSGRIDAMAAGQRAAVMTFDLEARLLQDLTADRALLGRAVSSARPGGAGTDYAAALTGAAALLHDSVGRRREVVMISDLQRVGLRGERPPSLPDDIGLEVLAAGPATGPNAAVLSADLAPGANGDARQTLTVRVQNTGTAKADAVRMTTFVDGRESDTREIDLLTGAARTLVVPVVIPDDRITRIEVRLDESGIRTDDEYFLVAAPEQPPSVLLVVPDERRADRGLFLRQALALAGSPGFDVTMMSDDELDAAALVAADVVILDDVALPGGAVDRAVADFVARGGGLLVVAAEGPRGHWPGGDAGYLPGRLGPAVQRVPDAAGVAEASDAVLVPGNLRETFEAAFADVDVFRYRKLDAGSDDRVLARFDDGAPALVERRSGSGRVLVMTTTLDPRWSTFVSASGIAPFVIETVLYLADRPRRVPGLKVDSSLDLLHGAAALPAGDALREHARDAGRIVIETPTGDTVRPGPEAAAYRPRQPGFHEFHGVGANGFEIPVAVNADRVESALASLDTGAFLRSVERPTAAHGDAASASSLAASAPSPSLWQYVLAAAALLLALEASLANRLAASGGTSLRLWRGTGD